MPITYTPTKDPARGFVYEWTQGASGIVAVQSGRVDCTDAARIFSEVVAGMPLYGDAWSAAFPTLRCVERRFEYIGGVPDAEGLKAWSIVVCTYQQPGVQILRYPLKPGEAISASGGETFTQRTRFPVNDDGSADMSREIDNGDGADVEVGLTALTVRKAITPAQFASFDLAKHISFQRFKPLNSAPVTIPNVNGMGVDWSFAAKQLRFRDFRPVPQEDGTIVIEYDIAAAPDHDISYVDLNSVGTGNNEAFAQVYRVGSFAGLWS